MSGGSHIAAVGPGETPEETLETAADAGETLALEPEWEAFEEEEESARRRFTWVFPALAVLAIAGWTGFFGFANQREILAGGTPQQWSGWIVAWAVPVLLVIGVWLVAMRSSSREAARFGDAAKVLSEESARLETRLVVINRELSLARDFIAAQSRDLESLGRVASERISEHAERISGLIHDNSAQIESIASVSTTALENMDKLRGDLPVVANSARDVTNQIGNAGRTANTQLEELVGGFKRLNEFGQASERQVGALREKFEALREEGDGFVSSLRDGEAEALEKWREAIGAMREQLAEALGEVSEIDSAALERTRTRLQALAEEAQQVDAAMEERVAAFMAGIETRRERHAAREAEEAAALEERLAALDQAVSERQEEHLAHVSGLAERGDALAAKLADLSKQIGELASQGAIAESDLANAVDTLAVKLAANRATLTQTDVAVASLTDSSVRLLELIQAGAAHSREQLPEALDTAQRRLEAFRDQADAIGALLDDAGDKGETLAGHLLAAQRDGKAALEQVEALQQRLADQGEAQSEKLEALRAALEDLNKESANLSEQVQGELSGAVERLQGALHSALHELDRDSGNAVEALAAKIGDESAEAIDRAIRTRAAEAIGELEQSAAHASGVSREAARQLRDQLAKVDELAGNLENRVQRARERAEEQVDNDFARRVALITEALNSHAIDISKALSNDVTDTAWASYLRGDRGIFTRRAVRLLDNSEAREIAEAYDNDHEFREHVSRYIHDFEAMLRTMLSTRDGHALGVTLLSSDMGKLYVALAQAIERLRD